MTPQEIRERILDVVGQNGGHLSSSLGAVEIAMALAEVFDPVKDRVVWDVGHQAYAWKMLTDEEWKKLLTETAPAECKVAALSGYAFAVEPPVCKERSVEKQMEYWTLLKKNYKLVDREEMFGQNATTLLMLKRK